MAQAADAHASAGEDGRGGGGDVGRESHLQVVRRLLQMSGPRDGGGEGGGGGAGKHSGGSGSANGFRPRTPTVDNLVPPSLAHYRDSMQGERRDLQEIEIVGEPAVAAHVPQQQQGYAQHQHQQRQTHEYGEQLQMPQQVSSGSGSWRDSWRSVATLEEGGRVGVGVGGGEGAGLNASFAHVRTALKRHEKATVMHQPSFALMPPANEEKQGAVTWSVEDRDGSGAGLLFFGSDTVSQPATPLRR